MAIDISQWVGFDLETAGADELFRRGPSFTRLAGYTDPITGEVRITTDVDKLIQALYDAPFNYSHNGYGFDLLDLAFNHGADWDRLTKNSSGSPKALDTLLLDRLDYPPRARDTGGSAEHYDLDHACQRRGIPGKTDNISDLAARFGGWDQIPLDDPDFIRYLEGDVEAIRGLIRLLPLNAYAKREHQVASLYGRITLNGFRVDIPLLEERISLGEEHKQECLHALAADFNLPLGRLSWKGRGNDKEEYWEDFKNPFNSLEGRKWLAEVWDSFGIVNPPLTDKKQLSTSAKVLKELAENQLIDPELRQILRLMEEVTTTRTVYQTVEDWMVDGWVHPLYSMGQASGRTSVTNPGLTVLGKRDGRWQERMVFLPDDETHGLITVDLHAIDMRVVGKLSGDPNYCAMLFDGRDPHEETAIKLFGNASFRDKVKPLNHGINYGLSLKGAIDGGYDPDLARHFFSEYKRQFPLVVSWQNSVREEAAAGRLIDNGWGRMMRCEPERAFTQGPALAGQGGAADCLKECLLRVDPELAKRCKVTIHDEAAFSVPLEDMDEAKAELERAFTWNWGEMPITCEVSKVGSNWGELYKKG